ncbi:MAG TPA: fluoride efflux transporter CrcB [Methylophaga aminisulfidivorans]|uniref:Fluoride-specific ion channel FluC n=2 Tax=root TaxID=1 RepID=A0A7C1W7K3_9GAMM|nr:fluoride efflux transporter CrcB [Methylophaga aminisulfidivorans]
MYQLIAIAAGGAIGSILRFLVSNGVYRIFGKDFPYGTLSVNVLGSFLMGLLFILFVEREIVSVELRSAVLVGLLGAFTTFSTFSIETITLLEDGELIKAMVNVVLSVVVCITATWIGLNIGRQL